MLPLVVACGGSRGPSEASPVSGAGGEGRGAPEIQEAGGEEAPDTAREAAPEADEGGAGAPEEREGDVSAPEAEDRLRLRPPASAEGGGGGEEAWDRATLEGLTLRQKAAQLVFPWVLGDFAAQGTEAHDRAQAWVEEDEVGGIIVSVGSPSEVAVKINDLQSHAPLPLLVAADLESGPGFRFHGAVHLPGGVPLGGATLFPPLMAVGATDDASLAHAMGRITALEARALGIHLPFAPVLDVNNNPENPIINTRSFGEDPERVARLGVAFIRGIQEHGAMATAKHFPGHGDTETDSHVDLPVIRIDRARMDSVELVPFRAAVDAGVGAVMTAHLSVPDLTGSEAIPATLSEAVLRDLLRADLGFRGLVVTDALDMEAIERGFPPGEAAVRALEAGADILLMPPDPTAAIEGVVEAVEEGRISEERLDTSVGRLLALKEEMGLDGNRHVDVATVPHRVGVEPHREVAREVARRSLTLLKNRRNLLPLLGTRSADVVSVTYRRPYDLLAGRFFDEALREIYPGLVTARVDRDTPEAVYEGLLRRAGSSDLVVVSLHVSAVSSAGSVAVPDEVSSFVETLEAWRIPHIVISFGNPYLLAEFPGVQAYLLAWGGGQESQRAVVDALFGRIPIRGRLPTRIPPDFEIGDGIQLEAKDERVNGG